MAPLLARCGMRHAVAVLAALSLLLTYQAYKLHLSSLRAGSAGEERFILADEARPSPDSAGNCLAQFEWIDEALDYFYEKAEEQHLFPMSNDAWLKRITDIRWPKDYPPGMVMNTLELDRSGDRYALREEQVHKPNQPWKPVGQQAVLRAAVAWHNRQLVAALRGKTIKFITETEDYPLVGLPSNPLKTSGKLPAFAMCAHPSFIDIPAPDFTFTAYPEAKYANSSWPAVRELLLRKSEMLPWSQREPVVFFRANMGAGPRRKLWPLFKKLREDKADVAKLGVPLDVEDTQFIQDHQGRHNKYVWLDEWCRYRYVIHTGGNTYSGALKYKLACGAIVFVFQSDYEEFFEPGLEDGEQVVYLSEDPAVFHTQTLPKMRQVITATEKQYSKSAKLPPMAQAARDFAQVGLSEDALYCYWFHALVRYGQLYLGQHQPAKDESLLPLT